MPVEGTWDLSVSTPIGKINAVVDLRSDGGVLSGVAHGTGEEVSLRDVTLDGAQLTWKQAITKPMRLNLIFTMTINGDTMSGMSKAGRLPASKATAQRRSA